MTDVATHEATCAQMGAACNVHQPVEAHKRFEPFVGSFSAECKMWMGPGDPMVSTGVMTNTLDLGGRYLRQYYQGDQTDGPFPNFEGRGYWGYNTVASQYEGFWVDTASTFMQTEAGDVDAAGKTWTMVGIMTDPQSGQPLHKRTVITLHDRDHHSMEMFFQGPEGDELKGMEIQYRRQG